MPFSLKLSQNLKCSKLNCLVFFYIHNDHMTSKMTSEVKDVEKEIYHPSSFDISYIISFMQNLLYFRVKLKKRIFVLVSSTNLGSKIRRDLERPPPRKPI